jgi:hypothetical protein
VVGDELGACRRGVVEEPVERVVVVGRAGAEVVGRVEQEPQPGAVELAAQRAGVAQRVAALGEHRELRRVDLHPREAGGPLGGERRGRGPGVAVDVEADAIVHASSVAGRGGVGVARP